MLISPLPLLPTSKSPASEPNELGAIASPHGWSSDPPVPTRARKFPRRTKSIHDTRGAFFVGDVDNAVQDLDVVRNKTGGEVGVFEVSGQAGLIGCPIEDIDISGRMVGGEEILVAIDCHQRRAVVAIARKLRPGALLYFPAPAASPRRPRSR